MIYNDKKRNHKVHQGATSCNLLIITNYQNSSTDQHILIDSPSNVYWSPSNTAELKVSSLIDIWKLPSINATSSPVTPRKRCAKLVPVWWGIYGVKVIKLCMFTLHRTQHSIWKKAFPKRRRSSCKHRLRVYGWFFVCCGSFKEHLNRSIETYWDGLTSDRPNLGWISLSLRFEPQLVLRFIRRNGTKHDCKSSESCFFLRNP